MPISPVERRLCRLNRSKRGIVLDSPSLRLAMSRAN
jgi:hypothetical protein